MRRPLIAGLALGSLLLAGCSDSDEPASPGEPVAQPPVELAVEEPTDDPVRIGVLATLGSAPGQGSDALVPAEGAQVAAYRLDLGGQPVELEVVDDGGTEEGAREAVSQLVDSGVSGIVAATSGDHVLGALEDAAAADTAVLLPYLRTDQELPEGAWLTGPSAQAVGEAMAAALADDGLQSPFVVTADGVTVPGLDASDQASFDGADTDAVVDQIRRAARGQAVDSAVIAGSATSQARLVSRLQGVVTDLPLLLTPEALSPVFGEELQASEGTTAAQFVTVGVDSSDTTTLTSGERGDAVAAYFSALRLLSDREGSQDLFASVPFSEVAGGADTLSHDAVVALVAAATRAGSTEPAEVRSTLTGLQVDTSDGLAGPALDFSQAAALPADAVVELNATNQDPGVRPGVGASSLFWFAVPAATG